MGFFKSLKANMKESLGISSSPPSTPREAVCPPLPDRAFPPPLQVLPLEHSLQRYRKQRGVNLGAWFVTEGWLNVSLYRDVAEEPKGSDFDLARSRNKEALEKHWDTFIDEEDWKWMKERGFNSVRLPVSDSGGVCFAKRQDVCGCGCGLRTALWPVATARPPPPP